MNVPEYPKVINPEAIGDPDQTPVVQLDDDTVAALKRGGFICECGGMNGYHDVGCRAIPKERAAQA